MNKERFHNVLAMRLGYERIVKDKRLIISIDNSSNIDDLWVQLSDARDKEILKFKASEAENLKKAKNLDKGISEIITIVCQAYVETNNPF